MPTGGAVVVTGDNVSPCDPVPAPLASGEYVRITIRDFGIGISRDHLSHVFDPFFTTKQEGSGLGLATAYSVLRKHDGIIDIESELGSGTAVHIYIPALPSAATLSAANGLQSHRGSGKILVLDDEAFVRDVAAQMLRSMGYSAEFAVNGEEAVAKYKLAFSSPEPFVGAILDLTIPGGMGGAAAVQEILSIHPGAHTLAASGYSEDPIMTDPPAFGFSGKIRKPFTKEELGDALEHILHTKKA
jgi:CheY-like chemotaxis protein